ncbi:MAG: hypothetical protein AB9856_09605 [Cellulosilyticaceae bacterium]
MGEKLILIEGIPGAGKTTMAHKTKEALEAKGTKVNLYTEGMSHPADMAWNALLTDEEYHIFLEACKEKWESSKKSVSLQELYRRIEKQARHEGENVILAYTKIEFPAEQYWELIGDVANREIGDGRQSLEVFTNIHLKRWTNFAKQANEKEEVTIFECAFLQNHICELLSVYNKSDQEIVDYLKRLISTVSVLNPTIIYLEPNSVEETIEFVARERIAPCKERKDWIDEIGDWVAHSNYGKQYGLNGKEGVINFCKERLRIDLLVLKELNVPVTLIKR